MAVKPDLPDNRRKTAGETTRTRGRALRMIGANRHDLSDLYHLILTLSWPQFFIAVLGFYVVVNTLFALAFMAQPDSIAHATPGSFADAFFFSIETLATVGYGYMNPRTFYGHTVAAIEILVGILCFAVVTGLVFARFSRPTARVIFSRNALIDAFNGKPTLMLRVANRRQNQILEAAASMTLVRDETTLEGRPFRRFYDLEIVRSRTPAFALTWTIMHTIDAASPLHGWTESWLCDCDAQLVVTITGLDETLAQAIHARHDYAATDILAGHQFVDVLVSTPGKGAHVDLARFHDVERTTPMV